MVSGGLQERIRSFVSTRRKGGQMRVTLFVGVTLTAATLVMAQVERSCIVQVESPKPGETVDSEWQVQGTVTKPPGTFLWVLAHREGIAQVWPQGGGAANISGRAFDVFTTLGNERDSGRPFEITVIVVDA